MAASRPVVPPRFAGDGTPTRPQLLQAPIRWPRPSLLDEPLTRLDGIGPKLAEAAAEAGVETIFDLLWRVPRAYGERPGQKLLGELEKGAEATVSVEVLRARRVPVRKRGFSVVEARVEDESGSIKAVWFNQPWIATMLAPGLRVILEGRLETKGFTVSQMEVVGGGSPRTGPPGLDSAAPVSRHPGTEALRPARWRRWAWQACGMLGELVEPVPAELLARHGFPGSAAALKAAHFPEDEADAELALRRLAWEELLLHQVVIRRGRIESRRRSKPAMKLDIEPELTEEWLDSLPFRLTGAQSNALGEIGADLAGEVPMRRLLMGEVGSGKTVVALWAMLRAVDAGGQSVLLAPTEVLAEQHAETMSKLLDGSGASFGLLTGSTPKAARAELLARLSDGRAGLVVGTHALLEPDVEFHRLALCVIDEEHRFGVRQKSKLNNKAPKGHSTHVLNMTATPIPRTLALTAYGDLDVTALRELPKGRKPIVTRVAGPGDRGKVFEAVRRELDAGRQAFVVCPLIEASESLEAKAATEEAERLRGGELCDFEVGLVHGRMTGEQKAVAMEAFADGRTDVLVATTVVEVGIDVPNATVIVVEGAERFGLSQLHQLRGRVGRGEHGGHCYLVSEAKGEPARRRLSTLEKETDGFRLADVDLEMRGEGEISGTRQSGLPRFSVARLPEDAELLESARADLDWMLDRYGRLDAPQLAPMADLAGRRFGPEGIRQS